MRRSRYTAVVLALVVGAAACSGEGPKLTTKSPTPSPSASVAPSATTAPTATATATGAPTPSPGKLSAWRGCSGGFQCATLTVPLDAKRPAAGTVGLAVTRHRATGKKLGSLLVNPGGPGASAVGFVQDNYTYLPAALRRSFDIAAFDPRGVGLTTPVRCASTGELDTYFHLDPVPDTSAELTALVAGNDKLAAGCQRRSGKVLPYVSTAVVAQDLDRVRAALGDAKLTYLGYSYGTAIGASYLDQFPTRVRAMVLDGALDPSLTWDQLLAGQSRGFDEALLSFLRNCERNRCAFRKAVSGDLTAAFDDLADKVDAHVLPGSGSRTVGPGEFSYGVGQALYSKNLWDLLAAALADAVHGKGARLLQLSDEYLERGRNGYANITEANVAVNCVDRPWPRTTAPYQALADKVGKSYPRFGPAIALSGLTCAPWPLAAVGKPHRVTAPTAPPVVVVGTTGDPATPYSWAVALADQLTHGVLMTKVGDGHTAYNAYTASCLRAPIDNYLVTGRAPASVRC